MKRTIPGWRVIVVSVGAMTLLVATSVNLVESLLLTARLSDIGEVPKPKQWMPQKPVVDPLADESPTVLPDYEVKLCETPVEPAAEGTVGSSGAPANDRPFPKADMSITPAARLLNNYGASAVMRPDVEKLSVSLVSDD